MTVARKLAVTAVLAAVLALAGFMSMTAKPAPALGHARLTSYATTQQPAAAANITVFHSCTTGSSAGNVTTCLTVYHNGRYVEVMRLSACVNDSQRELFLDIIGPNNAPLAGNDLPGPWVPPGSCDVIAYHPFATVPAGTYCGNTYRVSGIQLTLIGRVCLTL